MSNNSGCSSMPVLGLLGILFVGLKLTHYIDWSWWWVTLPFWGGLAFALAVILLILLIGGVGSVIAALMPRPRIRRFRADTRIR